MDELKDINDLLIIYNKYKKEEILSAIDKLDKTRKTIISMRYGINGYEKMTIKDISIKLNLKYSFVYNNLNYSFNMIEKILKSRIKDENKMMNNLLNIYDMCSKEDIIEAIYMLKEPRKTIMILLCGINGEQLNYPLISKKLKMDNKVILEEIDNAKYDIGKILTEHFSKYKLYKAKEILKIESIDELKDKIKKLPENKRLILEMSYGIIDGKPLSNSEIARRLNLTTKKVSKIKRSAFNDLQMMISEEKIKVLGGEI